MSTIIKSVRTGAVAVSLAFAVAIAGCGSDESSSDDTNSGTEVADATAATTSAEDPSGAVLETSPSLDIVGDPLPTFDEPANDAAVGLIAPTVTGVQFDGEPLTIGGSSASPTLCVFLAHWCPHCNNEIPEFLELESNGELPADLNIIGISTAVVSDRDNYPPSEWIAERQWAWPVLADSAQAEAFQFYGGAGFPYLVMLDADGSVLARVDGGMGAEQISEWISESIGTSASAGT